MFKFIVKRYCSEGSKVNQILIAILMLLPVFSYGTGVGWMSPMGPRLMSDDTPAKEPLDPEVISWMASIVYLVGTPAVFLFGFIVDNCGRKIALMITSLSVAMCWALKIYSTETWALITARAFLGLTVSGSYVVTPLYIKEISDDSIRGTLGSLVVLSQNLGNLVVYLMGTYMSYHCILWVLLAVPLVHLLVFTSMPDTPSYLLKSGKTEEARTAVAWLRCRDRTDPVVESELQKLQLELELNKSGKFAGALKTLVTDRGTFRAFRVTLAINSARELCGCVAVLHYASLIFSRASQGGWVLTPNQQAIMLGVVQMIGSLTASSLVERCGRKPLLASTCLVSGACMACAGACVWAGAGAGGAGAGAGGAWVPPLALCLAIYCDAAGLQPVPFVVMTEMFSFQLRGTVTSIVTSFACAIVSVELRVFQPLLDSVGLHLVFGLFAAVCFVSTVYILMCVPETRMRSIDEIYAELAGDGGKIKEGDCEASTVTRL